EKHRPGLVDADDRERLVADVERVAKPARMFIDRIILGNLPADDDVPAPLVSGGQEPAFLDRPRIDRALKMLMRHDVLALDDRLVEDRLDALPHQNAAEQGALL